MIKYSHEKLVPSVSIAIPTYNEAEHIQKVIQGFLRTKYSNLIEIIIVDGGSNDSTQKIVINLSYQDSRIKLIKNPLKIQAVGLNLALEKSSGEIFLRADAHAEYAPNYIEKCVEILQNSEALNVGGAQRFIAKTPFQAGIALASKSFLGSGGAKYRNPNYNGFADTVFLGCFWRKPLLKLAGYSTNNIANEDAELNLRLNNLKSSAIYISSQIKVWYFPRKTWQSLYIQYFQYGRGRYLTNTKHPHQIQLRGKIPFLSLLIFILLGIFSLGITHNLGYIIQELKIIFFSFMLESIRINYLYKTKFIQDIWRENLSLKPSWFERYLYCFISLFTMFFAHACGYSYQLLINSLSKFQKIFSSHKYLQKINLN